jgi:hypothetical protein
VHSPCAPLMEGRVQVHSVRRMLIPKVTAVSVAPSAHPTGASTPLVAAALHGRRAGA